MIPLVGILACYDNLMRCLWVVHVSFLHLLVILWWLLGCSFSLNLWCPLCQDTKRNLFWSKGPAFKGRTKFPAGKGKTKLTIHHWKIALKNVWRRKLLANYLFIFIHFRVLFLKAQLYSNVSGLGGVSLVHQPGPNMDISHLWSLQSLLRSFRRRQYLSFCYLFGRWKPWRAVLCLCRSCTDTYTIEIQRPPCVNIKIIYYNLK